ncbi:hypothetical protein DFJ73DRAFT_905735 [Zopfochytrium polystomum]|nr:hypothetical protein DFJ73DRAFT_905735 [Zopfochytrium polystomum]
MRAVILVFTLLAALVASAAAADSRDRAPLVKLRGLTLTTILLPTPPSPPPSPIGPPNDHQRHRGPGPHLVRHPPPRRLRASLFDPTRPHRADRRPAPRCRRRTWRRRDRGSAAPAAVGDDQDARRGGEWAFGNVEEYEKEGGGEGISSWAQDGLVGSTSNKVSGRIVESE